MMYKYLCSQREKSDGYGFKFTLCEFLLPLRLPEADFFSVPRASLCHPLVTPAGELWEQRAMPYSSLCPERSSQAQHQERALRRLVQCKEERPAGWLGARWEDECPDPGLWQTKLSPYLRNIHDRITAEGPGRGKIIGTQQGRDDPILINASDHGAIHEVNQPGLVHCDAYGREFSVKSDDNPHTRGALRADRARPLCDLIRSSALHLLPF